MLKKLLSICALFCVVALTAVEANAQQGPGYAAFKRGEAARRNNQLDQAIQEYQAAIQAEPNNYRYYARLGMVYAKKNQTNEARTAFENAVRVNPGFTSGYLYLSQLAMKAGDNASALRYINQAYDQEQDQAKKINYKLLAIKLLLKNNQPQQALGELQTVRSLAPNDLRVLVAEGDIQTALGNFSQAEAAYNGALQRLDPSSPPTEKGKILLGLAVAKYKSGDTNGANALAEQQLKPISAQLYGRYRYMTQGQALRYLTLARGYMSANMFTEAMENVNKAIEAGDKNDLSYKMQGLIYFKQGQMQQAIMAFTKSAEATRDAAAKASLYKMMVKLQFNAQMYRECVSTADNILSGSQDPQVRAQINLMKSQALYQLGQYQAAIQAAQTGMSAITGEPNQAVYQFVIGMSAKKAGDVATAKAAFEKAKFGAFKFAATTELQSLARN